MRTSANVAIVALVAVVLAGSPAMARTAPPAPPPSPSAPLYTLPPLPYPTNALEPHIDNETMYLHWARHHQASVNGLNLALAGAPAEWRAMPLHALMAAVGTQKMDKAFPASVVASFKNSGGSHWNHAFFWKALAPANATAAPSPALTAAINRDFGSLDALFAAFNATAASHFGSGWAWVCVLPKKDGFKLAVTSTPNQVNPLMAAKVSGVKCTPIMGIDVWEHAYYLKHRNVRGAYITAFRNVINWARVSANYEAAAKGMVLEV